ncbi:MAG: hypothetical protein V7K40_28755 [Nostoc sp.]|uniref:hypothetical protein n=1 Tax=Nostoc sp. TaxID=1180 RepID=UPI002FFBD132
MPNETLRLKTSSTAMKEHFQPEAGNEVLKGFTLKLTRMSNAVPLRSPVFVASENCYSYKENRSNLMEVAAERTN